LSHKDITNLTITHAGKMMNVISACAAALKGVTGEKMPKEMQDLQETVKISGRTVSKNASAMEQSTMQPVTSPPRVHHTTTMIPQLVIAA
jgi:hypothetical protein